MHTKHKHKSKTRLRRLLLALLAYLFFLAWTMPASQAYRLFRQQLPALKLETLDGTIWNAKATRVELGTLLLRQVRMRLQPLPLLAGRVSLKTDIESALGSLHGIINLKGDNRFQFKELHTSLDAQTAAKQFGINARLSGRIDVKLKNVTVDGSSLRRANGTIEWHDARITAPFRLALGTVRLHLKYNKTMTGIIRNTHPHIRLKGEIRFTTPKRYHLKLSLRSTKGLDPSLGAALDSLVLKRLGIKSGRRGSLHLQYHGSL